MKKILLTFFICACCAFCFAQATIDSLKKHIVEDEVVYERVVQVDSSFKKKKLFSMSQEWFVKSFNNGRSVIQSEDLEEGRIIGKGTGGEFTFLDEPFVLNFTIQIDVKDAKARIRVNELAYKWQNTIFGVYKLYDEYIKDQFSMKPMFFSKKMVKSNYLDYLTKANDVGALLTDNFYEFISKFKKDDF